MPVAVTGHGICYECVGSNNEIYTIALLSDGKVPIGGYFSTYDGVDRGGLARLNTDGTLDTTFIVGTGISDTVKKILIEPNNQILLRDAA